MSHEFYICRALYAQAREQGAPAVNVIRLCDDLYCAETTDGKLINENVSGCCKWAIKYQMAEDWLKQFKNRPD